MSRHIIAMYYKNGDLTFNLKLTYLKVFNVFKRHFLDMPKWIFSHIQLLPDYYFKEVAPS